MRLMTYNTNLRNPTETLTQKVNVPSEEMGKHLIAFWNRQAALHPPQVSAPSAMYNYSLVSFSDPNHEEYGTFHTPTNYEKADRDKYDR